MTAPASHPLRDLGDHSQQVVEIDGVAGLEIPWNGLLSHPGGLVTDDTQKSQETINLLNNPANLKTPRYQCC